MGQRLNITIWNGETRLANGYYHWSGYTNSAFHILNETIHAINLGYAKIESDPYLYALRLLEFTGAGLTDEEFVHMQTSYPNLMAIKAKDRNHGLIAVSNPGMNDTEMWEEARINIYIDSKTFDFDVFGYIPYEDFEDWYMLDPKSLPKISNKFSFDNVPFNRVYDVGSIIKMLNNGQYLRYKGYMLGVIG